VTARWPDDDESVADSGRAAIQPGDRRRLGELGEQGANTPPSRLPRMWWLPDWLACASPICNGNHSRLAAM
jgi:hypothetical protein